MTDIDLCSAVLVLHPQRPFPAQYHFLGRMVHRLFLLMLNQAGDSDLADKLHNLNGALPFTVSDLFPSGSEHYWIRITGLNSEVSQAIEHMIKTLRGREMVVPPRDNVDEAGWVFTIEAAVTTQHDWARQSTYTEFIEASWKKPPHDCLTLEFMTPTALKSVGVYRPFADPLLVFRLLYKRLLKIEHMRLPFQPAATYLEVFAEYFIETTHYQMSCRPIQHNSELVHAFQGMATYHLLPNNDDFHKRAETRQPDHNDSSLKEAYQHIQRHRKQYACLINFLAEFVFYSGLGKYTGQGMGMARKVERNGR